MLIKKGQKFNKLTAIKFSHRNKYHQSFWFFKCDCGIERAINVQSVKYGDTKSCGCLKKIMCGKNIKHGMSKTKTWKSWRSMKERCLNKNAPNYKNYGGRGIAICQEWLGGEGFENFFKDMGERPKGKSLDRIDNNGNYCKSNCRYATQKEQSSNTRVNHFLTYEGKTQTMKQWAEELGINYITLFGRIKKGWSVEKALTKNL